MAPGNDSAVRDLCLNRPCLDLRQPGAAIRSIPAFAGGATGSGGPGHVRDESVAAWRLGAGRVTGPASRP